MEKIRIGIAEDEPITRMDIELLLEKTGYDVIVSAANGQELVDKLKQNQVDIALIDVQMPIMDGHTAAKLCLEQGLCAEVIMLTAFSDTENIQCAKANNSFGYLIKPLNEKTVITTIEMAFNRKNELVKRNEKIKELELDREHRKTIDKAKLLLMKIDGLTEDEAFKLIRKKAMNNRKPMVEIAHAIITIYE